MALACHTAAHVVGCAGTDVLHAGHASIWARADEVMQTLTQTSP